MHFSKEEINRIINLKDSIGKPIDVFDIKCHLMLTDRNPETGFCDMVSENVNMEESDFEDCTTEEEVKDTFNERIWEYIKANFHI